MPSVVVKFYKNLHYEPKDVSTVNNHSERKSDKEGEYFNVEIEVIGTAGTWQIQWQTTKGNAGVTGSLPFNASVGEVQAACDAIGIGVFVVSSLGAQKFRVIWHASFGFLAGLSGKSIDLSGAMKEVGAYDVIEYTVSLTRNFIVGAKVPPSSVDPHGGTGGAKPSSNPVTGSRA